MDNRQFFQAYMPGRASCRWLILLLFWMAGGHPVFSQQRLELISSSPLPKGIALSPTYSDSQSLVRALHQAVNALQDGAYLEASLDSLSRRDSLWQAFLHVGPLFRWASLSVDGIPPEVLRGTGFRESAFPRSTVEPRQLRRWQDKLLESSLNRGYPFARIGLDDLEGASDQLTARLRYEPGPFILLDTLQVEGAIRLNRHFLENYLG